MPPENTSKVRNAGLIGRQARRLPANSSGCYTVCIMNWRIFRAASAAGITLFLAISICVASANGSESGGAKATAPSKAAGAPGSAAASSLFSRASQLISAGRYSEAIRLLGRAAKLNPDSAGIHHYLGYALWKLNRWEEARAEFETAHLLNPRNPYTCYFLARIAQSLGRPRQSMAYYQEILKLGPAIYDTNQRLGQAYLDAGNLAQARASISAALGAQPWNGSLYYQMGRIDEREHQAKRAQAEFAAAARLKNVNHASIQRLLQLSQAINQHDAGQIEALRSQILSQSSEDPEILDSAGFLLGRGALYAEAVEPLERAAALAPESFEPNYNLGLTLLKMGRNGTAEQSLTKALAIDPESPDVNRLLAILYVNEGRNREAIERLLALSLASPGDPRVLALLGEQYLAGHYVKSAIPSLQSAIRLAPNDTGTRYLLIEAYEEEFDYRDALRAARETARLFPREARAVYEVAQQYANLGDYKSALPAAQRAIQMDASLVSAYNLVGEIESKNGNFQAALEMYRKAHMLNPKNILALRGIGDNLISLGRFPEALAETQQALAIEPRDADLYFNLMKAYVRLGRRQEAAHAEATFQKLHAQEVAARQARAPKSFPNATSTANN